MKLIINLINATIYNRLKRVKGVVLIGRESNDVPVKLRS
ncbi:MAG: hypothetical protein BROFUL_03253 [Candidatus Brocadia fulgida]|uniref:Uncharacterized protein n=1 Tax=Candidatus Brocadia fulgida TaxID=380242 RepID=A0A0M2UU94_9BACT|nr:MAG: hypothetical protein BROFUL_03253 [Candidatus Brocadia fulgida]